MNTLIGLLRGINVGGKNKIKMAELRALLESAGLVNVESYIQSGNLVFDSRKKTDACATLIRNQIREEFGFEVPTMVVAWERLKLAIAENPWPDADAKWMHLTLLQRVPGKARLSKLDTVDLGKDRLKVVKDVAYICCPNGYSKTKLTNHFFESKLDMKATTRNWRTVNQLVAMAAERTKS